MNSKSEKIKEMQKGLANLIELFFKKDSTKAKEIELIMKDDRFMKSLNSSTKIIEKKLRF